MQQEGNKNNKNTKNLNIFCFCFLEYYTLQQEIITVYLKPFTIKTKMKTANLLLLTLQCALGVRPVETLVEPVETQQSHENKPIFQNLFRHSGKMGLYKETVKNYVGILIQNSGYRVNLRYNVFQNGLYGHREF